MPLYGSSEDQVPALTVVAALTPEHGLGSSQELRPSTTT
jgi:hypothetical protein